MAATKWHACMQCLHEGSQAFALMCEIEGGWSVHKTFVETETEGRDKHILCTDDATKVSHEGLCEDMPLMHTA
eukprot:364222-Chlamydomonas_euryale.AAC.8